MKKLLSVILSLIILLSVTGVSAFAATAKTSGTAKPTAVRISTAQNWVRVKRTIQLETTVYPTSYQYDSVEWYTLDYDLIEIDEYGEVTGIKPGIAHVEMYVYVTENDRKIRIGSASIEIEVRGSVTSYSDEYDPEESKSSILQDDTTRKDTISTKTINNAVKKALVKGTTKDAVFKNYTKISTVSLESAAAEMNIGGGVVLLNFDTMSRSGTKTDARLTINPRAYKKVKYKDPLQVGHSINVLAETSSPEVKDMETKFESYFKNNTLIIKMGQKGAYGMSVTCKVPISEELRKAKQSSLYVYTFDPAKGKGGTYRLIKNANLSVDTSKNINFTTDTGNYIIISEGKLTKW